MSSLETAAAIPSELIWRLNVQQYHAMIQAGILTDDDPVELLEGWLVFKMPKNPAHRAATNLVRVALESVLTAGWYVDSQEPITLEDSEPEPDVAIIRGDTRQYLNSHPTAADIALVVEVSDTTLQRDRTIKKRTYARAGIPIYWIVNLVDLQIEVYSEPGSEDYNQRQDYQKDSIIPLVVEGLEFGILPINTLLP